MADSQFVIDIAAQMPSGPATIAELEQLSAGLTGAGRRSDDFQSAIKRLSTELDTAKAASAAANAMLAEGSDQYRILEREALRASKALEAAQMRGPELAAAAGQAQKAAAEYRAFIGLLGVATEEQANKLRGLELAAGNAARAVAKNAAAQPQLAAQVSRSNDALSAYDSTLKRLETDAAAAAAGHGKLEKQLSNVNVLAKHVDDRNQSLNQRFEKLGQAAQLLPGPLRLVAHEFIGGARAAQGMSVAFGSSSAAALIAAGAMAAVVVALVAVTAAMIAGYAAAAAYAFGVADTARSAALSREAFAALAPETAAAAQAFDAVSAATGQTDAQLVGLTKQLRAAKVSASDMPAALRAAALAEAALGTGGASEFVKRLEDGTLAVSAFAAEAQSKFGGVVARQLQGLDAQTARFKKLWAGLFDGVNLEPVLNALGIIVDMFDKANPLAQALSSVIAGVFGPISDNAEAAAYAVEAFALGFAIEMTKAYIAAKPLIGFFSDFRLATGGAKDAGELFGKVLIGIAIPLAAVGVVLGVVAAALLAVPALIFGVGYALGVLGHALYDAAVAGFQILADLPAKMVQLGSDLIAGLVSGITAGATAIAGAVSSAVTGAIDTAKDLLGIHSPSKVFAEIGTNTVDGFTGAVEAGAPDAQNSMAALVSPAPAVAQTAASQPAAQAQGSDSGGGKRFDFAGATFVFRDAETAERARDQFARFMTELLEDDATSLAGAAV
jgi:hypothetical protein